MRSYKLMAVFLFLATLTIAVQGKHQYCNHHDRHDHMTFFQLAPGSAETLLMISKRQQARLSTFLKRSTVRFRGLEKKKVFDRILVLCKYIYRYFVKKITSRRKVCAGKWAHWWPVPLPHRWVRHQPGQISDVVFCIFYRSLCISIRAPDIVYLLLPFPGGALCDWRVPPCLVGLAHHRPCRPPPPWLLPKKGNKIYITFLFSFLFQSGLVCLFSCPSSLDLP